MPNARLTEQGWGVMKPRVTVITLGVDDLERSLKFYHDGLGLPTQGIVGTEFEHGALALFDLQHGLKLAIFPRSDLALDAKVPFERISLHRMHDWSLREQQTRGRCNYGACQAGGCNHYPSGP